jgi:hypothetical protein
MIGEGPVNVKNQYRNQLLLHVADKFDIHFWYLQAVERRWFFTSNLTI